MNKKILLLLIVLGFLVTLFFSFLILKDKGFIKTEILSNGKDNVFNENNSLSEESASSLDKIETNEKTRKEELGAGNENQPADTVPPAESGFGGAVSPESNSDPSDDLLQSNEAVEEKKNDLDALRQQLISQ